MNDQEYMQIALDLAKEAYANDEVPVGAIIVCDKQIIAKAYNTNFKDQNALAHAEIKAINQACTYLKSKDLSNCKMYVTLEPCMMCHGALHNARIKNVYFGAFDLKNGSIISNQFFKDDKSINWVPGILENECKELLQSYFASKREE